MSDSIVIEESNGEIIVIEPTVVINQNAGVDQIPADWNQADNTKPDFIKNKPTIPDELKDLADDAAHRTVTDTDKEYWNNKAEANDYALISDVNDMISDAKNPTVLPDDYNLDVVTTTGVYQYQYAVLNVVKTTVGVVNQTLSSDDGSITYRQSLDNGGVWSEWKESAWYNSIIELSETKVDKVPGKGLSTNDYTDTEKTKLAAAVTSSTIATIVTLTQTAYDALNPKVTTTLYVITGA